MPVPGQPIEKMTVYHKELQSLANINAEDFNPELHITEEDYKAEQLASKVASKAKEGGTPSAPAPPK